MKILLVAINAKYIHSNPAVYSLKSCAGEYESCVDIAEFTINQQSSLILREIYKRHPDVIAFSCYIWNYSLIDSIIFDLHKILPYTDVWAGGPEVSYNAPEMIRKWQLRGVMTGPGEGIFRHLVFSYVQNISDDLPPVLDGNRTCRLSLNEIPFWYKDLMDFENRIIYYESSRGCPFSCSYCISSIDKTMDFRSVDRVFEELDFFLEHKVPQVKFIDRTFNCNKDHALPIFRHILEHDNGITNFHFEIAADLLDENYFELLEKFRPGAVQLEIGVQSTYEKTIDEINRRMDFDKVAAAVERIVEPDNIHVHLDLIAGLPYEDLAIFQKSFNDVYALCPEQLQLGFLKVLKGSDMEKHAADYELVYTELPPYEVLSTKWLSYEDVCHLKQIEEVLEMYYNSGQFHNSLEYLCSYFDTPYDMYNHIASWYEENNLFGIQSSRVRKYEILLGCGSAHITSCMNRQGDISGYRFASGYRLLEEQAQTKNLSVCDFVIAVFREYLTCDLYLREHIKNRPAFCSSLDQWKDQIHDILYEESQTHDLFPMLAHYSYRELTKILHVEVFEYSFNRPTAMIFHYEKRSPLTKNCMVQYKSIEINKSRKK